MGDIAVRLIPESDGGCRVDVALDGASFQHVARAQDALNVRHAAAKMFELCETGHRPILDPVALAELGSMLRDVFVPPLYGDGGLPSRTEGRLLFVSDAPEYLNLPWELLPGRDGNFLIADARWSIRRTTRETLAAATAPLIARPLRILFTACAPTDLKGLDYEVEEEAILRIADKLGGKIYLDIAEAGTFDELRELISGLKPHVVHLSGHGVLKDGVGWFAFENDRGRRDDRDARDMAEMLFADSGVRAVFVSGCQTAQAGAAGVCQTLTATGHVPVALGWAASIGDDRATEFARVFYHEIASGQCIDHAVSAARRELFAKGRMKMAGADLLDASFALPQVYAAEALDALVDEHLPIERPERPGVRYELLGDNIRGLREGFVGRRRVLQRTRPALRSGETHVLLLTGIGGAGKSTLATRLANRCKQDGYRIAAVQARRDEATPFCLRLVTELATACQRLGREADERMLRDGERPLPDRLRLAVEVLNEAKILLVLDNLEALMPPPPAPPKWIDADFAEFVHELTSRLTGEGRAILTCRYVHEGFDTKQPNLAHEALPDFTEADFLKYLRRHERVASRMNTGELSRELLALFHKKLGSTPRFVELASAVLVTIEPDRLLEQLERPEEPAEGEDPDEIHRLQQEYFRDLFLPQLYDALPPEFRLALSRFAVVEPPLPLDGVARVAGLTETDAEAAVRRWLGLGLLQRFGEVDETPLFAVYSLQRDFLTHPGRLDETAARAAHQAAAAFFQECYEKDRHQELRLPIELGLLACLVHATAAGDRARRRWAAVTLGLRLIRRAEYAAALALVEPLLADHRHPDLLEVTARVDECTGNWKAARGLYEEILRAREAMGDRAGEAGAWHDLATIDVREGSYAVAREKFGKSLAIKQAIGDRAGEAGTWHNLATIDFNEGNYAVAREKFGKALAMRQSIGDRAGEANTSHQLATIDVHEGSYAHAREKFGKSLAIKQAIGDRAGEAGTWHSLATIDLIEGNYADAREKFGKALAMLQAIGDRAGEAATLYQIGFVAWGQQRRDIGIRLVAVCLSIESAIGSGGVKETLRDGLLPMAAELGLDEAGLKAIIQEARETYQRDRAASLVAAAFEGL